MIDSLAPILAPFLVELCSEKTHSLSVQSGVIAELNPAFQAGELDMLITSSVHTSIDAVHYSVLTNDPYILIAPSD